MTSAQKKQSFVFILALLSIHSASAQDRTVVDRILAVVEGDIILLSEMQSRAAPYLRQALASASTQTEIEQATAAVHERLTDMMIQEKLITSKAAELEVQVTSEDVDERIAMLMQSEQLTEEQFWTAITDIGFTRQGYRDETRRQLLMAGVMNRMVRSRVNITESDVKRKYDESKAQARLGVEHELSDIFFEVPTGSSEAIKASIKRQAETVQRSIDSIESYDQQKNALGGIDLGMVKDNILEPALGQAVRRAMVGQVIPVTEGSAGFHILLVRSRRQTDGTFPDYESVKQDIYQDLLRTAMERQQETFMTELKRDAHIERKSFTASD